MHLKSTAIAAAIFAIWAAPALAEDKIIARVSTSGTGEEAVSQVWFAYESCEEECHVATLVCQSNGNVTLTIADVAGEKAATIFGEDKQWLKLVFGKKAYPFLARELDYMEMTGSWWISGDLASDMGANRDDLARSFAGAATVFAEVASQTVELPVTDEIKSWALACAK
jgi:hypothetical protein